MDRTHVLLPRPSAAVALLGALLLAGCGSSDLSVSTGGGGAQAPVRSTAIQHEPCEGSNVDAVDVNGDGKADIRRVLAGGKEMCRVTDLNRNGKPDLFQYFDASGTLRRREADYDESGVVDAIEYFEGGKLARVEYDTLAHHKIDTWDFYDTASGKLVRRERDTRGSGKVDQWWTWEGEKVTVAFDRNGDGQPDPSDTIGGDASRADGGAPTSPAASNLPVAVADAGAPTAAPLPVPAPAPAAAGSATPAKADPGKAAPKATDKPAAPAPKGKGK